MIAIDIETSESDLQHLGPGPNRDDSFLIMIGLYDGKDYVCCKPDDPRLRDWLASDEDKVFHNGTYDLTWLLNCDQKFEVGGTWHDTMTRCALIDEAMDLDLDSCCKKFNIKGKNKDDTIDNWFATVKQSYGLRGTIWNNIDFIYAIPEGWVQMEKYNRQDCKATYDLFMATEPYLRDLQEPYQIECDILKLTMDMRKIGIRIDTVARDRLIEQLRHDLAEQEQQMYHEYKINGEIIASPKKMTLAMNALGIRSPRSTPTGNQSWDVKSLPMIQHPVVPMIQNFKNMDVVLHKFLLAGLTRCVVNGRIYTAFSPTKRDEGGTVTFRYGSRTPNLQNISSRNTAYEQVAYGPEMRNLFLPEEGCMLAAADYGQIEYRIMAHYATGPQADWFREQCRAGIDMHSLAMERTKIDSRYIIKRINFGVPYGMGIRRMVNLDYPVFEKAAKAAGYDDPFAYGKVLMDQFKQGFPVLFDMMKSMQDECRVRGYVETLSNRRVHRPRPEQDERGNWNVPYYKIVSRKVSGSAADILKRGLVTAYKAGVFKTCPMHLTVHDENVVSVPYNKEGTEALQELLLCMLNAYKERLSVPLTVSCEVGPSWGYWKDDIWEDMQKGVFGDQKYVGEHVNKYWSDRADEIARIKHHEKVKT